MIPLPSEVCFTLVASSESFRSVAYLDGHDEKAVWTLGYGTVYRPDGTKVKEGDTVTEPVARVWKMQTLIKIMQESLNKPLESIVDLEQHQVDSLCSLIYNIGQGAWSTSSLLKMLKARQVKRASHQFLLWDKDHGKVVAGLTRRRRTEQLIYEGKHPWHAWNQGWLYIKRKIPPGNPFSEPPKIEPPAKEIGPT